MQASCVLSCQARFNQYFLKISNDSFAINKLACKNLSSQNPQTDLVKTGSKFFYFVSEIINNIYF